MREQVREKGRGTTYCRTFFVGFFSPIAIVDCRHSPPVSSHFEQNGLNYADQFVPWDTDGPPAYA